MALWNLDDIPWQNLDRSKVRPEMLSLVKAASMVEHNSHDYARYLCEVFTEDAEFQQAARDWAEEEVQHGKALRKWAELADPSFNFDESFRTFTTGYKLPLNVKESVRGSHCGELVARCVVEIGTSSYYTAIKDATEEPVLKIIAAKIAADEYRHYKLFYTHLQRYIEKDKLSALERLRILLSRIAESEDDELAYAYFAAHNKADEAVYDRKTYSNHYLRYAFSLYQRAHVEKMVSMGMKAVGFKPHSLLSRGLNFIAWNAMRWRLAMAGA